MTLAQYRKDELLRREEEHGAEAERGGHPHPGPAEYARVGVFLAVVTTIEVALYYIELDHTLLVVFLMILSAIKFGAVVLWFMHLKFDNPLFSQLFAGGFILAVAVFMVALATVGGRLV